MAGLNERQMANFLSLYMPEPNSGCFLWIGYVNSWGYGRFNVNGTIKSAHRVAFEEVNGEIPTGMLVLHSCDTPSCVNPDHLRLGTDSENGADKAKRRRAPTKLNDDQVRLIRAEPGRYRDIAEKFDISAATVCLLKARQRRIHVRN